VPVAAPAADRPDAFLTEPGRSATDVRRAKRRSRGLTVEMSAESRPVAHYV